MEHILHISTSRSAVVVILVGSGHLARQDPQLLVSYGMLNWRFGMQMIVSVPSLVFNNLTSMYADIDKIGRKHLIAKVLRRSVPISVERGVLTPVYSSVLIDS